MKIQVTMSRKEVARTMKMIEFFMNLIEKVFGKTFSDVDSTDIDKLMDSANNNVSYGVGHRAEVHYTTNEIKVSINIKEKMYDASCLFVEKIAEKITPLINFCMAGVKMLEAFCESFKSDVAHIQSECFNELEKELEASARYAVIPKRTLNDDYGVIVFKRYADSKITEVIYEVYGKDAIAFEMHQLKAFGKKLNSDKFIFDSFDKAIEEVNGMHGYQEDDRRIIHVQHVQEEKGE